MKHFPAVFSVLCSKFFEIGPVRSLRKMCVLAILQIHMDSSQCLELESLKLESLKLESLKLESLKLESLKLESLMFPKR